MHLLRKARLGGPRVSDRRWPGDGHRRAPWTACKRVRHRGWPTSALTQNTPIQVSLHIPKKLNPGLRPHMAETGTHRESKAASVSSITNRSIPITSPAVGGIPYSRARTKSAFIVHGPSSPASLFRYLGLKTARPGPRASLSSE